MNNLGQRTKCLLCGYELKFGEYPHLHLMAKHEKLYTEITGALFE